MPGIVDQILDMKAFNLPVGQALMLTAAFGLTGGMTTITNKLAAKFLPAGTPGLPLLTNGALALGVTKIDAIRNFIGPELAEIFSIAALTNGINGTIDISGLIANTIAKVTSLIPGMGDIGWYPSEPIQTQTVAPSPTTEIVPMSGYSMSGSAMGAANVDDVDLLLMSARGYQTT